MFSKLFSVNKEGNMFEEIKVYDNPDMAKLKELSLKHCKNALKTNFGAFNLHMTVAKARSAKNTYIITDNPENHTDQCISTKEGSRIADLQNEFIKKKGEIVKISGYIGNHPDTRVVTTLYMTPEGTNMAAMQKILYFPVSPEDKAENEFTLIYTPDLTVDGYDDGRIITVDLDSYVTRVIGSDYFGESKKGGLRMLNHKVYKEGGLVLHAGAKIIPVNDEKKLFLVMGLSGTGKTTSTFSKQGDSKSIQDDKVMLYPGGKVYATEDGCFAKTDGLTEKYEPIIYSGAMKETAWFENVYQNSDGVLDFHKDELTLDEIESLREQLVASWMPEDEIEEYISGNKSYYWTKNGRVVIPMKDIKNAGDSLHLPNSSAIGVLNRNQNIIPGVVKFSTPEQAAAYFMLGETTGTSAGGSSEAGKSLRSPFTNPFFPLKHYEQAHRYLELVKSMPEVLNFMMNTGWIGGTAADEKEGKALKVKIPHSSAILKALAEDTVVWKMDPDFGYEIAEPSSIPDVPKEILNPVLFYEKHNRLSEYKDWVERLKKERLEFLSQEKYNGIDERIINAIK